MIARTGIASILLLIALLQPARADDCDPLKPHVPANTSREVIGKIDAKLEGLAKRLANIGAGVEGTYREMSNDVLKEYPNADKVLMWGQTIWMFCRFLIKAQVPDSEKLDRIQNLWILSLRPPPQ